jgi:hypothetical protein
MHRLQISLSQPQVRYLADRARREGVSIAELIRRLVQREAESVLPRSKNSLLEIIGIGKELEPLIGGIPVSEQSDLYLCENLSSYPASPGKKSTKGRKR